MRMCNFIPTLMPAALFLLVTVTTHAQAEDIAYIAGTTPSERPANAPVIAEAHKDAAWYATALTGVEQPYPYSLKFLEDQGNWFTPFDHPGMTPPYDLRGWHSNP